MGLSSVCTIEYSRFWTFYECSKFFFQRYGFKSEQKPRICYIYWSCIKRMVQTKYLSWSHTTFFFLFLLSFLFFLVSFFFWHKRVGQVRGIRVFISSHYLLILLMLCPLVTVLGFQMLLFPTFVGNTRHRYENKPLFSTTKYHFKNF